MLPRDLDGGEKTAGQIVGERQAKENIRLRDEGAGGTERGRGWRRGRARDDWTDAERDQAERGDPPTRAKAIVEATAHYTDAHIVAKVSRGLGEAMRGLEIAELDVKLAERGW